ncbi:hypothetical protein QE152_g36045 [Popillia japonica]|uniref:Protein kinase domain-containing protein n=1 Tax=Popillia japonica TaxID=7064 RepID=A0AAW1IDV9_POPJA
MSSAVKFVEHKVRQVQVAFQIYPNKQGLTGVIPSDFISITYGKKFNIKSCWKMISFDDYEMLKILGRNLSSACYKVKEKKSSELKVFRVIPHTEINGSRETLLGRVSERIGYTEENFLRFEDYILDSKSGSLFLVTLFLVTEYCKYGSLYDIVKKCNTKGIHLKEDFIWYVCKEVQYKRNTLERGFYMLSSLNLKPQTDRVDILSVYSDSLRDMIMFLLDTDLKDSLDIVLWHPMVFPRRNQKFESGIFNKVIENQCSNRKSIEDIDFQSKLENFKNREVALQIRESKLIEIEHDLVKRQNKIALLEKAAKEKLLQADLRLKRINNKKHKEKQQIQCEKLDNSSSVDYCDSVIITTSSKLNHDCISKSKFARSVSERRIKFKGHSPLKAVQISQSKPKIECENNRNKVEFEKNRMRTNCNKPDSNCEKIRQTSKKRLSFLDRFTRKNTDKTIETRHSNSLKDLTTDKISPDLFKPIIWTEENKRQAFSLLRIMNSEPSSVDEDYLIKHTKM